VIARFKLWFNRCASCVCETELEVLSRLRSPYLMGFFGAFFDDGETFAVRRFGWLCLVTCCLVTCRLLTDLQYLILQAA
jgi:hypothetical protein